MMNLFRLAGDATHLTTMVGLLLYIWRKQTCAGISGRTQCLFGILFTARYLDLFIDFVSVYNSIMKVMYLGITYVTVLSIYFKYHRDTYCKQHDTFRCEVLVVAAGIVALFVNYELTVLEVSWAFSEYLEVLAVVPQLYLVSKAGKAESVVSYYIFGLACYRSLYIINWAYRYYYEGYYSVLSIVPGILQVLIYLDYFFAVLSSRIISKYHKVSTQSKCPVYVLTVPSTPQKTSPVDII